MFSAGLPVLGVALAIEATVGDPVSRWHPVALFGRVIGLVVHRARRASARRQLAFGAALVLGSGGIVSLGSALFLQWAEGIAPLMATLAGGVLLKLSFSYRQLRSEVLNVAAALEAEDAKRARDHLRALVSRDTASLAPAMLASAAVESLAENLCDSVVAPLFYYLLLGVPGALAYRAINTLDAMVGYHGDFEYLGRAAAKADDWVNWVPARITALLLVVAALILGKNAREAWAGGLRQHRLTESPNAGWPMAAMAGSLGVRLEKRGHYRLGESSDPVTVNKIREAIRVADGSATLAGGLLLGAALL